MQGFSLLHSAACAHEPVRLCLLWLRGDCPFLFHPLKRRILCISQHIFLTACIKVRAQLAMAIAFGGAAVLIIWWLRKAGGRRRITQKQKCYNKSAESPCAGERAKGVVNDAYEYLLGILQESGEGREALNDALQAARADIVAHFSLDDRQRAVSDADRNPNKRARAQARRDFFIATLARTLTAVYCLAYTRALMHMKLLVLRRTLGAQREYLEGVGWMSRSEGCWPTVTDGGEVKGIDKEGASERGLDEEREKEKEKERERQSIVGSLGCNVPVNARRALRNFVMGQRAVCEVRLPR